MKNCIKVLFAALLLCMPLTMSADDLSSNKALSSQYKSQIKVVNQEIKTLKAKKKIDPSNTTIDGDMIKKKAELADLKSKKKVVDTAIKTEKARQSAEKAAKKAQEKAEKTAAKAAQAAKNAAEIDK